MFVLHASPAFLPNLIAIYVINSTTTKRLADMKILGLITLSFMAYTHAIRIAIVGAGAGGSSAAYYLTKAARQNGDIIDIDVFEKRYQAGGS